MGRRALKSSGEGDARRTRVSFLLFWGQNPDENDISVNHKHSIAIDFEIFIISIIIEF